ncbi:MAG: hypothetical protein JWP75_1592 [Frondihabitans sp.]|nr:hypothetical protein [Frondihabitans sp.]
MSLTVVIVGMSIAHAPMARATDLSGTISAPPKSPAISQEELAHTVATLEHEKAPRTTSADGSVTYPLGETGVELSFTPDPSTSRLGGGKEKNGQFFISFNQTDQDLLMAGFGVALGAAICAVPVVGQIACAVVGAIISFGMVFVSKYGKCAGKKQLIVHVNPSWSTCR